MTNLRLKIKKIEETGEVSDSDLNDEERIAKTRKPTRRDKRSQKKFDAWKENIEASSGFDYDTLSTQTLTPE